MITYDKLVQEMLAKIQNPEVQGARISARLQCAFNHALLVESANGEELQMVELSDGIANALLGIFANIYSNMFDSNPLTAQAEAELFINRTMKVTTDFVNNDFAVYVSKLYKVEGGEIVRNDKKGRT